MYKLCVGKFGMDPKYFLREASMHEVSVFLEGALERERTSWEQSRMVMFVNANAAGAKLESPSDLFPLPWENLEEEETEEERLAKVAVLREAMKKMTIKK